VGKTVQTTLSKDNWQLLRTEAGELEISLYELIRAILLKHIQDKEKQHG